jgi:hypothetical protein
MMFSLKLHQPTGAAEMGVSSKLLTEAEECIKVIIEPHGR